MSATNNISANQLELNTLLTLKNGLTSQLEIINKRIEEITNNTETKVFTCELFNKTFTDETKYNKHITSKVYYEKKGLKPMKCKLCNRVFYTDKDLSEHHKNGLCEKSRTYNGILFSNMQSKSCYMKKNPIKLEKVKVEPKEEKEEKKAVLPINNIILEKVKEETNKPVVKTKVVKKEKDTKNYKEKFNKLSKTEKVERGKYKLLDLPQSKSHITASWYMSLYEAHKSQPFTDGEGFYTTKKTDSETGFKFDKGSSFRSIIIKTAKEIENYQYDKSNDDDEDSIYLTNMENGTIYWSDGTEACTIENKDNNYYEVKWKEYK